MKATEELKKFILDQFGHQTYVKTSKQMGFSRCMISHFMAGTNQGLAISRWVAKEFNRPDLLEGIKNDIKLRREREARRRLIMQVSNVWETHHVLPNIDTEWSGWQSMDNIPVLHPQPEIVG